MQPSRNYQSFEEFYLDVVANGQPFRVYTDRSYTNSVSCFTAVWGAEEPEPLSAYRRRTVEAYQGYWDVDLHIWKAP
jgi:hypothetical protein